jgi:microcystin-dependent protein
VNATADTSTFEGPGTKFLGAGTTPIYVKTPVSMVTMAPTMISVAGSSQAHTNIQPFLVLNFCIALSGIFPSRN